MHIKIVGVGKCGSRICYDFFAQVRDLPSAYQIRAVTSAATGRKLAALIAQRTGYAALKLNARMAWEEFVGNALLRDTAVYGIVDSDLGNNEVIGELEFLTSNRQAVFPGTTYKLAGTDGGCQYHVVSERLANAWTQPPLELLSRQQAEIFAFAFSVGGGTGGGAAALLAAKCRMSPGNEQTTDEIHFMGIAILPTSDRAYFDEELASGAALPMDDTEKYNTGRFFVSLLGQRLRDRGGSQAAFNGVWLISNDLLRSIISEKERSVNASKIERALDNTGISLVNSYIGLALCTVCNASSRGTNSFGDFDAKEMNSLLPSMYVTAFGHARRDPGLGFENLMVYLSELIKRALSNATVVEGQMQGLSVPTRESELRPIQEVLSKRYQSFNEFRDGVSGLRKVNKPRMFSSAKNIVAILGQPQGGQRNPDLHDLAKTTVFSIFENSNKNWYTFQHAGQIDYLIIFLVDPWIPVVVDSMFDYISRTWLQPDADAQMLVGAATGDAAALGAISKCMFDTEETEHLGNTPLQNAPPKPAGAIPFSAEHVMQSVRRLAQIYTWKKSASPRSSD